MGGTLLWGGHGDPVGHVRAPGARPRRVITDRSEAVATLLGAGGERAHSPLVGVALRKGREKDEWRRGRRGVRAVWAHGAEADPAPPRPQDAPQEQAQQEDIRPAGGPPHGRPLLPLPPAYTHRPRQQGARARVQHARGLEGSSPRGQVRRVGQAQAARHLGKRPPRHQVGWHVGQSGRSP